MSRPPNILFLMTDQMQAAVLEPAHPCRTPSFERLCARGVRFTRAYTPNAVCSPARASLMTGRLPHSHGVLSVTHTMDRDQLMLRTSLPHWAQRLSDAGYHTGYFGKWHVEHSGQPDRFGWRSVGDFTSSGRSGRPQYAVSHHFRQEGYPPGLFYAVSDAPMESRHVGQATEMGMRFMQTCAGGDRPWCCFVSVTEPHDPYVCGRDAFEQYDPQALPLSPSLNDDLAGRPGLYRKARRVFDELTVQEHRLAAACYYALITEIDQQFGRLLEMLETTGQVDNTIVVLTTDHGDALGAHGLYMKNIGAFEETYNIPLVLAGPGVAQGRTCGARVGLHDLCPTLVELAGGEPIDTAGESQSFADVLGDPEGAAAGQRSTGYAEYFGTRYLFTQRVIWDGNWKLVWNGFDFDELYNLKDDPHEVRNLAENPAHADRMRQMLALAWDYARRTNDHTLVNTHYPVLRLEPYGPQIATRD